MTLVLSEDLNGSGLQNRENDRPSSRKIDKKIDEE